MAPLAYSRLSVKVVFPVEPGEEKPCEIVIPKRDLRLYDKQTGAMVVPEHVCVYIGKNASDADGCCIPL